ncbi:MAG: hypothetical protein JXA67_21320 [Micromonosporaceae bacterium]|nr:hypothetical protein [Micromonosporaceae bacterium]
MGRQSHPGPQGLKEFLTVLDSRLAALPAEQLRAVLIGHAERLAARDRAAFLAIFPATAAAPGGSGLPVPDAGALLADIDAFVEQVRSGAYFEGWGWDDDLHEERAWGDESWAGEMDDLFAGAADAFLAGDLDLARNAYGRLLDAFRLDEEVGAFCGPASASDMVDTDVTEAVARYLRAVYETTPQPERAGVLYRRYTDLCHRARSLNLQAIADTRRSDLPDLERFLPGWIEILTEHTGGFWARDRQRLLTEATVWHAGTDGLGPVARRPGDHQPTAYLDWIDALTRDGRLADAAAAAREALSVTGFPAERAADAADRLAMLNQRLGDPAGALDATHTAWRAHPTRPRLMALVAAAQTAGALDATLSTEADRAGTEPDRLTCELLLLAGRIDAAADRLAGSDPLGWSQPTHPGPVVWPHLLAATAPAAPDKTTHLGRLFAAIDTADRWYGGYSDDFDPADDLTGTGGPHAGTLALSTLLAGCSREHPGTPAQRQRWLTVARDVADRRIDAVVSNKHRGAYQRVAVLAVAYAESLTLDGDPSGATAYIAGVRARYPRHTAFRAELDRATAASPLLPASHPRRR